MKNGVNAKGFAISVNIVMAKNGALNKNLCALLATKKKVYHLLFACKC
jgi:hypothetical protein